MEGGSVNSSGDVAGISESNNASNDIFDMQFIQLSLNATFFAILLLTVLGHPGMFFKRHGRYHALLGFFHLHWLIFGFLRQTRLTVHLPLEISDIVYDTVLGISGTCLALTAAVEFQHKSVVNFASGTLDEHATVTYGEMIEHSFYQGLNLAQILFLHVLSLRLFDNQIEWRVILCIFVTSPWLLRQSFPINSFSDNYNRIDERSSSLIRFFYWVKKWQYVFYKHFLLHGLVVTVAFINNDRNGQLVLSNNFRMYWLLLNTSYVMEFFMQSLVKKKYMTQETMLAMQVVLMVSASISAIDILLNYVNYTISIYSLLLNFYFLPKQDFLTTMGIICLIICCGWFS